MNKINALFILLILVISLNFFFPSELHPLFFLVSVYTIFLIYLSMNIEVVYLNKELHASRVSFLIAVFVIISFLLTSLTGVYLSRSRDYFCLLIGYMLIIFFIKAITLSESKIWAGLNLLVLFASIVSLYALTQYFTDFFQLSQRLNEVNQIDPHLKDLINLRLEQKRVFAFFPFPTTLSAFLAMILPFNIGQLFKYKTQTARTLILLMLGLNITALFLIKSYGGIITLAAVALIIGILFLTKKRKDLLKTIAAIALILVLIVGGVILFSFMRGGLFEFQDATNPVVLRLANWKAAIQIISDYPLLGVGLGNYATVFPQYYLPDIQPSQYAHNTYLQIASEVGIPIASVLLILIIAWGISTLKVWYSNDSAKDDDSRRLYIILLASSLAFIINNCFEINAYYTSLGFLGFLSLGLLHKICTQSHSSPEGTLFWKERTSNTSAISIREQYAVIILIIAWFMATGVLGQRFLGIIFYQSATYDYKSGRIISAENDLRLARFMDPLDSRYYQLDSLVKLRKADQVPSETREGSAIKSARHAVALNPRTPHLRNNLANILFQQGRYWNSMYQLYWADSLMPFVRKYRENLELFKKTLLKK